MMTVKFNSKIGNSYMTKPRRNKKRFWMVLILFLAVGGYFALPTILKSIPQTKTTTPNEAETEKQIIKTIPLPEPGSP